MATVAPDVTMVTLLSPTPELFNRRLDATCLTATNVAMEELSVAYTMAGDDPRSQLFPWTFEVLHQGMKHLQCRPEYTDAWESFCNLRISMLCTTLSRLVHQNVNIYHLLMLQFTQERLHLLVEYEVRLFVEQLRAWAHVKPDLHGACSLQGFVRKSCSQDLHVLKDPAFVTADFFFHTFQAMHDWFLEAFSSVAWNLRANATFAGILREFEPKIERAAQMLRKIVGYCNTAWCSDQMLRLQIELVSVTSTFIHFGNYVHDLNWTSSSHVLKLESKLTSIVYEFLGSPWQGTGICHDILTTGLVCVQSPVKSLYSAVDIGDGSALSACYVSNAQKTAMQIAVLSALHPRLGKNSCFQMLDDDLVRYIMQELLFGTHEQFLPAPLYIGPFDHICC